jgi:zinc transporter ZupT
MTQPRVALYGACRAESERERWVEEQEMMIIAEISDKMLTVPWLWATMAVFAVPFLAGAARRWLACVLLPFALLLSGWMAYAAYHEAFLEAGMKEAIHHEMGTWWIINSISSACLPGMAAIGVMAWTMRKTRQPNQASEGIPRKLGNPQG